MIAQLEALMPDRHWYSVLGTGPDSVASRATRESPYHLWIRRPTGSWYRIEVRDSEYTFSLMTTNNNLENLLTDVNTKLNGRLLNDGR